MNHTPATTRSLLYYGMIALPIAFAGFPLYVLAPDFYATHYGLSLSLLGALLLPLRFCDAVLDPLFGWLIDRLQGRYMPLISVAGSVLCLSIFGLFNRVFISPEIWFALCVFLAVCAYSLLTIAVGAKATLWTTSTNDQTRIAATREAFGLIGLVIAVSMPSLLARMIGAAHVFLWYSAILALLMMGGIAGFSHSARNQALVKRHPEKQPFSLVSALHGLSSGSLRLFAVYSVSMLASSIPAVLVIFYVRDRLQAENLTGLFLLLYFLFGAAGMPLWRAMSERFGKHRAWFFSNLLAVVGFSAAFFLRAGDILPYAVVCVASGIALGADLTLPPSILADEIHAHGHNQFSGTHYACLAFISKVCLALASAVALPALDAAGFQPHSVNSEGALCALSTVYAFVPSVLKLSSAALLYVLFIRSRTGGHHDVTQNAGHSRSRFHV